MLMGFLEAAGGPIEWDCFYVKQNAGLHPLMTQQEFPGVLVLSDEDIHALNALG